jgi:phosphotransferase system HPr-like phosphotransfer protein
MVLVNSGGTALTNDACTSNQLLQFNGTSWACVAATSLGTPNAVVNNGNSYAGTMTVGTNDNNELRFETNGTDKVTILANGNVGVGTTSPTAKLETAGTGSFQNQLTVGNDGVTNTSQLIVTNSFTTGSSSVSLNTPNNSAYIRQSAVSGGDLTINSAGPVKLAGNTATITTGGGDRMFVSAVGQIGVNTLTPSAIFDITSTTSGLLIPRMTTAQRDAISSPANGLQVYNTTTSQLNYYNGTAWQALGVAGAGISSLTAGSGLTGGTITTSGTIAVDTGTTANKIVQLNASAELPAVSGVNLTNLNASNIASGTLAAARLPSSGVTAGSYGSATQVPAITVDAYGRVTAVTATTIALPASAITSGTLNISQGGTGAASLTANRMVMVNGTGTALTNDACTVNQLLQYNGNSWGCVAASSLGTANAVVNNGNSYAGTMTVGTNDNNELRFETNGTDKMTVLANGNVGIGTTSPNSKLQVTSDSTVTSGSAFATSLGLQAVPTAASTATFFGSSISATVSDNSNTSGANTIGGGFGAGALTNSSATSLNRAIAIDAQLYSMRLGGASTATVNEAIGIQIGPMITAGGSIGRYAGATIMNNTSATHNVGIFMPLIGGSSSPNGNWTIYSESSFPSYFGGKIGIGTTSPAASASLDITSTNSGLLIPRMTTAQRDGIASPANGLQVYNTTTSQLNFYNGSSWQALGVAGAGISSLTAGAGLTGGTITTSGTIAVDTGTTANKIVQLNASAELPAVSGVNLTNLNASNIASGTLAAARLPNSGVTAGSYGSATQVPAITVDAYGRVTSVTATTIALPASAITSGTLNISQGGTGASTLTANRLVLVNGTGTALTNDLCTVNQVLQYSGTSWACVNSASLGSSSAVLNGGNSFAGTMTVGTNDNNELRFETNGTDKMTVLANGNVGVGQTAPTERLHVAGNVRVDSGITFGGGAAVGNLGYVSGVFVLDSPSASPLGFSVNGASRMRIGTDGNVGIGPSYAQTGNRLEVQGGAIAAGPVSTGAGNAGQFRFYELAANGTNFFALRAPDSLAADLTFTLPSADGSNGQVLTTNGSGVLSWSSSTVGFPLTGGIGSATAPTYSFAGDTNTGMYSTGDNEIAFSTDGARRLGIYWWGIQTSGQIQNGNWETTAYTPTSASLAAPAGNVFLSAGNTANVDSSSTLSLMQVRNTANAAQNGYFGVIANMAGSSPSFVFGQSTGSAAYAERMRIDGSGNLGIGTTAPLQRLDVNGYANVRSGIIFPWTADTTTPTVGGTDVGIFNGNGQLIFNQGSSRIAAVGIYGSQKGLIAASDSMIGFAPGTAISGGNFTSDVRFDRFAANSIRLSSNGTTGNANLYVNGNVGIGTTTPRSKLEVAGGIQIADDAATCDATKVGTIRYNSSTIQFCNGSTWAGMGGGAGSVVNGGNSFAGTMTLGTNDNNELRFETNGTDKMTILANGNVGIGTTTTASSLEVSRPLASMRLTSTVGKPELLIGGNDNNGVIVLGTGVGSSDGSAAIIDNRFVGDQNYRIGWTTGAGGVGGNSNPDTSLSRSAAGVVEINNGTAGQIRDLNVRTLNPTGGNVGINNTAPGATLDVNGNTRVGSSSYYSPYSLSVQSPTSQTWLEILNNGGTNKGAFFGINSNSFQLYNWQGGPISFFTHPSESNGTERMRIDNAGNVGIGTTTPSERLHVVGNLRVQGSTDCTLGNGSGATMCSSDERLKTNITIIPDSLQKILSLRGVSFDWNEKARAPGKHEIGVIAQDVEKVFPTAVATQEETGYKMVDYAVLVAPLIESVKALFGFKLEQDEINVELKAEVRSLASEDEVLKQQLKASEARDEILKQQLKISEEKNKHLEAQMLELQKRLLTLEEKVK